VRVFISWSGEPSRSIARVLRGWLQAVAQHVEPWMSDQEIETGRRWNEEIAKALDDTDFGIVCVTAENQHAPWLMFEAGGLAKRLGVGRVVPLRIGLKSAQLKEPLASFQGVDLNKEGVRRLVQDVMALRDNPLSQAQVDEIFEDAWPRLEAKVDEAMQQSPDVERPSRSPDDMLEEVLEGVRRIEREQSRLEALERQRDQGIVGLARTATDTAEASDYVGRRGGVVARGRRTSFTLPPPALSEDDPS
jgi:hypothetical protein